MFKHVDFEVPDFGEFEAGPIGSGGAGVVLRQSAEAAMPDRGAIGLAVEMEAGEHSSHLEHDLGEARARVSTRVMLNPATATGGSVSILRAVSDAGLRCFDVVFDAATRRVRVESGEATVLESWPLDALAWHCVEVTVDVAADEATLRVNGLAADTKDALGNMPTVRWVRLGAMEKATTTEGTLYLDAWVMAEAYIGPVVLNPASPNADDPRRWLVIYNRAHPDAAEWAEHYRQTHGIPYANLLGLNLSSQEIISQSEFGSLKQQVADYLDRNGLAGDVLGILCGHGVPGAFEGEGNGELESVSSHLHRIDGGWSPIAPPLLQGDLVRPTQDNLEGVRMTARIDGPTLAFSKQLVDRAAALTQKTLGDDDAADPGRTAAVWLDANGGATPVYQQRTSSLLAWAESLNRQRMRLPLNVTDGEAEPNPTFASIHDDGFFWGWSQSTPPSGFFGEPAGQRVFCMQIGFEFATGGLLRDAEAESWVMRALASGYAATAGSLRPHSASFVPRGERFFEALARGWSLGEAWLMACDWLRTPLALVGDPLLKVRMPGGGWHVYGGGDRLEMVNLHEPIAVLRESQREWEVGAAHLPADGEAAVYVVQHVDEHGREERSARHVRVRREGEQLLRAPWGPCWPTDAGWRPMRTEEGWRIDAIWPARFDELDVATVALERQIEGEAVHVVAEHEADGGKWRAMWVRPIGGEAERFRIRTTASNGVTATGPWSAWLEDAGHPVTPLQLI